MSVIEVNFTCHVTCSLFTAKLELAVSCIKPYSGYSSQEKYLKTDFVMIYSCIRKSPVLNQPCFVLYLAWLLKLGLTVGAWYCLLDSNEHSLCSKDLELCLALLKIGGT
ncbi:hypothetical protein ACF0H5_012984 [Mactra antiquata]